MVSLLTGKLIKRQRLPKNDVGDHWHWKDLNLGMNVTFYGKVFHIYDSDKWSRVRMKLWTLFPQVKGYGVEIRIFTMFSL